MDDISTIYGIQKLLKDGIQRNTDTLLSGNIDSLEKYQYILGQIRAYEYTLQEISNLLKTKEHKYNDGTIINLSGDTST